MLVRLDRFLGVIDRGKIDLNAHVAAPSFYLVGCEVGAFIGDDTVGDTVTVYDPGYEVYHWSGLDPGYEVYHGTKSSILYLHGPTVRPKYIVRLFGYPLIQDSLSEYKIDEKSDGSEAWTMIREEGKLVLVLGTPG